MADEAGDSASSSTEAGTITLEQLQQCIESLQEQNTALKVEVASYKSKEKVLREESKYLRKASTIREANAEQEYFVNALLRQIQVLEREKQSLAYLHEREEAHLANLSKELSQLKQDKCCLEQTQEKEMEGMVNKLMTKIEKLEAESLDKQKNLEKLRREKVELENALEQEQDALVNEVTKRMEKLDVEERVLQMHADTTTSISAHRETLRQEKVELREILATSQQKRTPKMQPEEHRIASDDFVFAKPAVPAPRANSSRSRPVVVPSVVASSVVQDASTVEQVASTVEQVASTVEQVASTVEQPDNPGEQPASSMNNSVSKD